MLEDSSPPIVRRKPADRPAKPFPKFPLYAHPSGMWAKKIRGKLHYFGRWGKRRDGKMERVAGDGWKEAGEAYEQQAVALHSGRTPRIHSNELTVAQLCNHFLTAKLRKTEAGELSPRTFLEYRQTTDRLITSFGKGRVVSDLAAPDFDGLRSTIAKLWGPVRLANEITRVKAVFKYANDNGLIEAPVRFGSEFRKPSKTTMRKHKATAGKLLFTAGEIHAMLAPAGATMCAAIMLGLNCGLGNADISELQFGNLDLDGGWLDYPRSKTGIGRRCPLWAETVKALREAIAARPAAKDPLDEACVFLTVGGRRFVRLSEKSRTDYLSHAFPKLLTSVGVTGRSGLGFYSLRHTLATVGLQAKDRGALKAMMGHSENDMLSEYDETGPSDERLHAVAEHVRQWWISGKPV